MQHRRPQVGLQRRTHVNSRKRRRGRGEARLCRQVTVLSTGCTARLAVLVPRSTVRELDVVAACGAPQALLGALRASGHRDEVCQRGARVLNGVEEPARRQPPRPWAWPSAHTAARVGASPHRFIHSVYLMCIHSPHRFGKSTLRRAPDGGLCHRATRVRCNDVVRRHRRISVWLDHRSVQRVVLIVELRGELCTRLAVWCSRFVEHVDQILAADLASVWLRRTGKREQLPGQFLDSSGKSVHLTSG